MHGRETTSMRNERSLASARLAVLEWAGHTLGIMHGSRTRGRKPTRMSEVELELQEAIRQILLHTCTAPTESPRVSWRPVGLS